MRNSKAAYGIIKHQFDMGSAYLLRMNRSWNNQYNFISGHMEPEDRNDYKNTIIREIEEELPPLKNKEQFVVRPISEKPFKDDAYSLSAQVETTYVFYIFQIFLLMPFNDISFLWEGEQSLNRWFTEKELKKGKGKKGEAITRFPVPQIIEFIPGGLDSLQDSFIPQDPSRKVNAIR